MDDELNEETIGMLLDIEHLHGEHEGRLGPLLSTMLICAAPVLLFIYTGAYVILPIPVFIVFEVILSLRTVMIILGRERHRVKQFKKQLNDDYTNTADLMNIRTIHPDGCVEYTNSKIIYLVCCFNGTSDDEIQSSIQLRRLLENMVVDYEFDVYIHNVNDSPALRDYYNKIKNFAHNDSARNFINIIDHTIKLTGDTSLVQCTIYAIKGYRSDWKTIKTQIDAALNSKVARRYKTMYRVSDVSLINEILNRNIDSTVPVNDLIRRKYSTQQYSSSKVLAYDLPEGVEIVQGLGTAKPVVNDVAPKKSFHIEYKEDNRNRVPIPVRKGNEEDTE